MPTEKESLASPEIWENKTILIVDDDEGARELGRAIFRRQSATTRVLTANDGEEAIEKFKEVTAKGGKIDLVITDYHMPNKDGPQLISWLRSQENLPRPLVVLASGERFTGLNESQRQEAAKKYQADIVTEKPYSPLQLIQKIIQAWQSQKSAVN